MKMIFVECHADETLIKAFGIPARAIKHEYGKARACNRLKNVRNSLALLDEDPLAVQHPYIIFLSPRLEEWIIKAANEARINLGDYGLSGDPDKLHDILSSSSSHALRKFENLLKDLVRTKKLRTLKDFIIKFKEK